MPTGRTVLWHRSCRSYNVTSQGAGSLLFIHARGRLLCSHVLYLFRIDLHFCSELPCLPASDSVLPACMSCSSAGMLCPPGSASVLLRRL